MFLGGALGAGARFALDQAAPRVGGIALDILLINVAGAFLLALAVGYITGAGEPSRAQLRFRLFFGTGAMGGFTTYSTLAFETSGLVVQGRIAAGLAYGIGTVILGGLASAAGLWLGRRIIRARSVEKAGEDG